MAYAYVIIETIIVPRLAQDKTIRRVIAIGDAPGPRPSAERPRGVALAVLDAYAPRGFLFTQDEEARSVVVGDLHPQFTLIMYDDPSMVIGLVVGQHLQPNQIRID